MESCGGGRLEEGRKGAWALPSAPGWRLLEAPPSADTDGGAGARRSKVARRHTQGRQILQRSGLLRQERTQGAGPRNCDSVSSESASITASQNPWRSA
eukprot:1614163-Alexandrium_andersonii.AAC.1